MLKQILKIKNLIYSVSPNYTGKELLSYLVDCYRKQPSHKEWYQILLECGVTIPHDIFFDEVISSYPDPINGISHFEEFHNDALQKFAMSYPEKSALWAVEREYPSSIRILLTSWAKLGKERAEEILALLPNSKEKEEALDIIAKMPNLSDLEVKLQSSNSLPQGPERQRLIHETIYRMAKLNPVKAFDWVVANLKGDDVLANLSVLAPGLGEKAPLKAKEILSFTRNQQELKIILSNIMKGMVLNGIEETENFIGSLDDVYRREAYKAAAFRMLKRDPFTGINLYEKYGLEIDERDFSYFITNAAKKDFDQTYDYIQKFGDEKDSLASLVHLAVSSSNNFPLKTSALIKDLLSTYSIKIWQPPSNVDILESKEFKERAKTNEFQNEKNLYNAVTIVTKELFTLNPKVGYNWLKSIPFKNQENFDKSLRRGLNRWKLINSVKSIYKDDFYEGGFYEYDFSGFTEKEKSELKQHIDRIYRDDRSGS